MDNGCRERIEVCVEEWKSRRDEHLSIGDGKGAAYYKGKIDGANWVMSTILLEEEFRK